MKKIYYLFFIFYFFTSCNQKYPETFYGIRLGKNSKEEFLNAKKEGFISINDKENEILMTLPFGGIKGKIDFWSARSKNTDGILEQIDIAFFNKIEKNNDEYLLYDKYQQIEIINFFEKKYGVIDKSKKYTDINDESINQYYSNEVIDLGYGFPKIKQKTYQWLNENLKIRLIIEEKEGNKFLASASYFYSTKYQDLLTKKNINKKTKKF